MSPPATLLMWFQLRSPDLAEDFEQLMAGDRDIVRGSLDTVSDWRLARPADVPGQARDQPTTCLSRRSTEWSALSNRGANTSNAWRMTWSISSRAGACSSCAPSFEIRQSRPSTQLWILPRQRAALNPEPVSGIPAAPTMSTMRSPGTPPRLRGPGLLLPAHPSRGGGRARGAGFARPVSRAAPRSWPKSRSSVSR